MSQITNSEDSMAQTDGLLPIYKRPKDDKESSAEPPNDPISEDPVESATSMDHNVCFVFC